MPIAHREPSHTSPNRTASERLLELAGRLDRALAYALPKLPQNTQAALSTLGKNAEVRWALALVLAGWTLGDASEPGAPDIQTLMKETGAAPLIQQIRSLQMLLPSSFGMFLRAARAADADHKIAGAGTYLLHAFGDMAEVQLNALQSWLRGVQFQDVSRALLLRFPLQEAAPLPALGVPGPAAPVSAPPTRSRVDRFDRADFTPRTPPGRTPPMRGEASASAAPSAPRPPTPILDEEAVTRGHLATLRWNGPDIDRLLSGPAGQSGTARAMKDAYRAYTGLPKQERMRLRKWLEETETGFGREDWKQADIRDVQPVDIRALAAADATTAADVHRVYAQLPVEERKRFAKLVNEREQSLPLEPGNRPDKGARR